jgi:glycosyltransferase involved in cell wall biosynthesis
VHNFALNLSDYLSTVILIYFVLTNGMYTVLMAISLYAVTLHARHSTSRRHTFIADSPATPPVALIVPAHNEERAIVETVLSLLALDYPEKEIVVVDDGSTDDTVARLAPRHDRGELTLIRVPHRGPAAARNAGILATRDEFVAFLDADDTLAPDALRVLMEALAGSPAAAFCITDAVRVYPDRTEVRRGRPPAGDLSLAILRGNFVERAVLFRRQDLLDVGLFDESLRIFEDWDLYIRLLGAGRVPVYVEGEWYRYVARDESLTRDLATMATCKQRVLAKHHRRLAERGVPGLGVVYADQMWWLARLYAWRLWRPGAALRCLLESGRFDRSPRRLLRAFRTRLGSRS